MRLGLSTLFIVALASASLVACGDSDTGSGGGGGAGGGTGTGGDSTATTGTGGETGTGGGGGDVVSCTVEVVATTAECDEGCDGSYSNGDETANLCTTLCEADADCDTANTDLICDGALGACVFSCADGAPGCPNGFICDDAETGAGTLLCIPDELSE